MLFYGEIGSAFELEGLYLYSGDALLLGCYVLAVDFEHVFHRGVQLLKLISKPGLDAVFFEFSLYRRRGEPVPVISIVLYRFKGKNYTYEQN